MNAAMINRYGGPDVLELREISRPLCREGEVLVKVNAASLNPVDCTIRKGKWKNFSKQKLPWIPGADFSGTVVESKSDDFIEEDEIYGVVDLMKGGACAEFIVVKPHNLYPKPDVLTFHQAAAMGVAGLTSLSALMIVGKTKTGDHVLLNGCTGSVGHIAIQMAKSLHAKVTGVCSMENADFAKKMGVDRVIDYRKDNLYQKAGYDLIFDIHGNLSYNKMKANMKTGATFITLAYNSNVLLRSMYKRFTGSMDYYNLVLQPHRKDLSWLSDFIEKKHIRPHISHTFSLSEIAEAHRIHGAGGVRGKIIIVP
jgi:NADPH:quinone reductase-like Zn-dependent oxidoreductase